MDKKKHIVNGLSIARALTSDYIIIYYVDIEDDSSKLFLPFQIITCYKDLSTYI